MAGVIITGASRGIGLALAEGFAAAGQAVVLVARDAGGLAEAVRALDRPERRLYPIAADVTVEGEVARLFKQLPDDFIPEVLVNNVGHMAEAASPAETSLDEWRRGMDGNLTAAFLCSREFARLPRASGRGGAIINTGSHAARDANRFFPYGIWKSALETLTRQLAAEWYGDGITVNCVIPPFTDTPGTQALGFSSAELREAASPRTVVPVYLWLAGPEGRRHTGRVVEAAAWLRHGEKALRCRRDTWKLDPPWTDVKRRSMGRMAVSPVGAPAKAGAEMAKWWQEQAVFPYPELRPPRLLQRLAGRHGVFMENVLPGAGSVELIRLVLETFTEDGDEVILPEPGFAQMRNLVLQQGLRTVPAGLNWDERSPVWGLPDLDRLPGLIGARTRIVYLIDPHNPTGAELPPGRLEALLGELPAAVTVLLDEAYADYVPGRRPCAGSAARLVERHPNLVVLRTLSKAWGLAGLRFGYAVAARQRVEWLRQRQVPFSVNLAAQAMALLVLEDEAHVGRGQQFLAEERERLARELGPRGIRLLPSRSNLLVLGGAPAGPTLTAFLAARGVRIQDNPFAPGTFFYCLGDAAENSALIEGVQQYLGAAGPHPNY